MPARRTVKICGLRTEETLEVAAESGADMLGFVFFPLSPRHLELDKARELGRIVAGRARKAALVVDASDETLDRIVQALEPDLLQLHGRESPARVAELRRRFRLPIIKAIGVASPRDLESVGAYEETADLLLFDAKPGPAATRPGGNGSAFDWAILKSLDMQRPWLLSGGLTPDNVFEAMALSGAPGADVSSGVESAPGVKAGAEILRFIEAVRRFEQSATDPFPAS